MGLFHQYQDLIGTLTTLAAALIGFWGVIYSQRKLTRMAHDERVHDEQAAGRFAALERRNELESFLNAIVGELSALQFSIEGAIRILQAQVGIAEELARQGSGRKTQPRVAFHFATPVFDSLVGKIGILNRSLSYEVSKLYGQFKSYSMQAQDQVPEIEAGLAGRIMQSVQESLRKLSVEAEMLKSSLLSEMTALEKPI
ncbi:hypothetical protein [Mesorhizobium sp. ES1-3]|uniref:hypothetical protein n=1 Tax=Mesorhizobium sp. ES1-3 TaxID=2876628 RepID=UPI001CCCD959|nr:hypothetical protein [Mesorhizobium sp. ES1-3]MBZ9673327.1 hypothetical protein [Mesorhizobium sp. ES1-3]